MQRNTLSDHANRNVVEDFNPNNRKHIIAYVYLVKHGRQMKGLRFRLEFPFTNLRALMETRISEAFYKAIPGIEDAADAIAAGKATNLAIIPITVGRSLKLAKK